MKQFPLKNAIGIFDSGIGGLSVFREIRKLMPEYPLIYLADQAHVPYGPRSLSEVRFFSDQITQFLFSLGAEIIVVACNTASAAALYDLRRLYSEYPFIGMEPAVKPAAEQTATGAVGVLATPATFQGKLYSSVVERFAKNVKIYQDTCPGLVQEIEKGNFSGKETKQILENALIPMLEKNIDRVVLGCTHYPFVIPLIKEIVGETVTVIDPAPAVARQTYKIAKQIRLERNIENFYKPIIFTTGKDLKSFQDIVRLLIPEKVQFGSASWSDNEKLNLTQAEIEDSFF